MSIRFWLFCLGFKLIAVVSTAQSIVPYSIIIDEIMPDPAPQVGLPNNDWIELKNISPGAINLAGFRIGDENGMSGPMPDFILMPDSFVIVCTGSAVAALSAFGQVISVSSFPNLDNDGETIFLRSPEGKTIHALQYSQEWFQNAVKKEGGWSLEMIDTRNPCSGKNNWKVSTDMKGGSPGKKNSVDGINPDDTPPQLKRSYSIDHHTIVLVFDEPIDSTSASDPGKYLMTDNKVLAATASPPLFNSVIITLNTPLQNEKVYTIATRDITDCKGNNIGVHNSTKAGISQEPSKNDMVINEILFNPKTGANDYVEFYNRSNKIIDASNLYISNSNNNGSSNSLKKISNTPLQIFPGDYIVLTEDAMQLGTNYFIQNSDAVINLSSLPSLPDDKGTVVLLNAQGIIIDEVNYSEKWHFQLITNNDGVALERIDPSSETQNEQNWHSAASTAGYGTPGYQNSQFKRANNGSATIEITPKIFSLDNDGFNDVATINYNTEQSGYVGNVIIFDAGGNQVRHLVKNAVLAIKGFWSWDGLGENGKKLPIANYIIYAEVFNLEGKKESFKNVVVLGRRLN